MTRSLFRFFAAARRKHNHYSTVVPAVAIQLTIGRSSLYYYSIVVRKQRSSASAATSTSTATTTTKHPSTIMSSADQHHHHQQPDELYTLRTQYMLGHYTAALQEAKQMSRRPISSNALKIEREEYIYRCYIALQQYDKCIVVGADGGQGSPGRY